MRIQKILVPVDASVSSYQAAELAIDLTLSLKVELAFLFVTDKSKAKRARMKLELIYETSCPNKVAAKNKIKEVLKELKLDLRIDEVNKDNPNTPIKYKNFASPTILLDGKDISDDKAEGEAACRIYWTDSNRMSGVPPKELLKKAILANREPKR